MASVSSLGSSSSSSSDSGYDSDEEYRLAQEEWEESLKQLQLLVSVVLMPFFGKWLGRKWSHLGQFGHFIAGIHAKLLKSVCSVFATGLGTGFLPRRTILVATFADMPSTRPIL